MSDPQRRFEILRDMWDRGVKFVTGMDSGMTNARFDDFAYIPQVMVEEMDITPMEAIVCSTQTSAECLGIEGETGTLEVGKAADMWSLWTATRPPTSKPCTASTPSSRKAAW